MGSIKKQYVCVVTYTLHSIFNSYHTSDSWVVFGDFLKGLFISTAFICLPPFRPILKMEVACSSTPPNLFTSEDSGNW